MEKDLSQSFSESWREYKLGINTGIIFWILLFPLGFLMLFISNIADLIILLFSNPLSIFLYIFPEPLSVFDRFIRIIGFLIMPVFYAYLGFLIQRKLRNKGMNEKIVVFIPIAIIGIIILSVIIEAIIRVGF